MFWAQPKPNASFGTSIIKRIGLDGNGEEQIFDSQPVYNPAAIGYVEIDPDNGKLYFSDRFDYSFRRINLDGSSSELLFDATDIEGLYGNDTTVSPPVNNTPITLDLINQKLYAFVGISYLTPQGTFQSIVLFRSSLDGSGLEALTKPGEIPVRISGGFQLDIINGFLYFGNLRTATINRLDINITTGEVSNLIELFNVNDGPGQGSGYNPVDLELDVANSKIYVAGSSTGVFVGNLDGTESLTELTPDIPTVVVNSITLDLAKEHLYYVSGNGIRRMNTDGTGIIDINVTNPVNVQHLALLTSNPEPAGEVAVTEFLNNSNGTPDRQFIELINYGTTDVDLTGWTISDEDGQSATLTQPAGYTFGPNDYMILVITQAGEDAATAEAAFETEWFAGVDQINIIVIDDDDFSLDNADDEIILKDNLGNIIWSLAYIDDETEAEATYLTTTDYANIPMVFGSKASPGVNRAGDDLSTPSFLGYESNNGTEGTPGTDGFAGNKGLIGLNSFGESTENNVTDPQFYQSANGNWGSPQGAIAAAEPCTGPTITTQPQDLTVASGGDVTFSVTASGTDDANLSYQWQLKPAGSLSFANLPQTGPSLNLSSVTSDASGNMYRVIVMDDNGTPDVEEDDCQVISDIATLTINAALPELFWSNNLFYENEGTSSYLIQGAKLDGSGIDSLTTSGFPFDIAVDTAGGKMYWVNVPNPSGVFSANLDGSNAVNLTQGNTDIESPFSLALDLLNRKIYVYTNTYQGAFSSLIRMNLDGSNIELISSGLDPFFNGFKLDLYANKLYTYLNTRAFLKYDWDPQTGSVTNPVQFLPPLPNDVFPSEAFDIDLENCQLYFAATNIVNGTGNFFQQIYRANLDGSGVPELLETLTPADNNIMDLSLDLTNEYLYFSLRNFNRNSNDLSSIGQGIDRIDLDGSNRIEIISLPDEITSFLGQFTQINAPVANTDNITRIKVAKLTNEEGNPSYGFTGSNGLGAFTVVGNSFKAFPNLTPGTYIITEDALAQGITLEGITIEGDLDEGSVIDLANRTITVDLDQDEDITVTFNNVEAEPSLEVTSFILVDADSDMDVTTLLDGETYLLSSLPENFNIIAIVEGELETERVVLELIGPVSNTRTERKAPYAVFGDSNGDYSGRATEAGMYEISATPYYVDGTSMQGAPLTVAFEIFDCAISGPAANAGPEKTLDCTSGEIMLMGSVAGTDFDFRWEGPDGFTTSSSLMPTVSEPGIYTLVAFDENMCSSVDQVLVKPCPEDCTPEILRFVLVNSDTDQDIRPLMNNTNIDLTMAGRELNIRAEVLCGDKTESVKLELTGAQTRTRTESKAPYALAGDSNGDYSNQNFVPGSYTLTATPYTENSATGDAGTPLTINFTVSNGPVAQQSEFGDPSLYPGYELSVFPVPASDELFIDMKFFEQGQYQADMFDVAGRAVISQKLIYDDLTGKRFTVNTQHLSQGVYMLRITGQNYQEWKKVSITK